MLRPNDEVGNMKEDYAASLLARSDFCSRVTFVQLFTHLLKCS